MASKWQGERQLQCLEPPLRESPLPVFLARHVFSLYVAAFFGEGHHAILGRGWAFWRILDPLGLGEHGILRM